MAHEQFDRSLAMSRFTFEEKRKLRWGLRYCFQRLLELVNANDALGVLAFTAEQIVSHNIHQVFVLRKKILL